MKSSTQDLLENTWVWSGRYQTLSDLHERHTGTLVFFSLFYHVINLPSTVFKRKKTKFIIKMLVGWTLELSLNVVSSGWGLGSACTIQAEGHSAVLSAPPHPVQGFCKLSS